MSAIGSAAKAIIAALIGLGAMPAWPDEHGGDLSHIALPPGFHIEIYAQVPGARTLTAAPELGAVLIGTNFPGRHHNKDLGVSPTIHIGRMVKYFTLVWPGPPMDWRVVSVHCCGAYGIVHVADFRSPSSQGRCITVFMCGRGTSRSRRSLCPPPRSRPQSDR